MPSILLFGATGLIGGKLHMASTAGTIALSILLSTFDEAVEGDPSGLAADRLPSQHDC
jgi:hypothetical protein